MKEDRSILDFVTENVGRLRQKIGGADRGKLDQYLEAVRDVERRIQLAAKSRATRTYRSKKARSVSRRSSRITTS